MTILYLILSVIFAVTLLILWYWWILLPIYYLLLWIEFRLLRKIRHKTGKTTGAILAIIVQAVLPLVPLALYPIIPGKTFTGESFGPSEKTCFTAYWVLFLIVIGFIIFGIAMRRCLKPNAEEVEPQGRVTCFSALTLSPEPIGDRKNRRSFIASFVTLFLVPMTLLILIFSAFELRPPLIAIDSQFLRWLVEYKNLYARYEHAVMSWRLVFFLGLVLALFALVIESVVRRYQGNISVGFHTAMAFLVALYSFWAVGDFQFSRYGCRYPEVWLDAKYVVMYSALKNAILYATVCWLVCRLIRTMNHRAQPGDSANPDSSSTQGTDGR